MQARFKHSAILGSGLLSLGLALLWALPQQQPSLPLHLAMGSRALPWLGERVSHPLDVAPDPSQDLYELASFPEFQIYLQ